MQLGDNRSERCHAGSGHCNRRTPLAAIHAYEAHRALTLGLLATEQWPGGFYEILDSMRRRSASTTLAGLMKYVAPVERWLDQLPDDHGGVLRQAVRAYRQTAEARAPDHEALA